MHRESVTHTNFRPLLAASHARYDAIFLDAYRQPYIPFYLVTQEFFALVRDRLQAELGPDPRLGHLSMGMSNDFEVAVEEGATLVRLGTVLFDGLSESER